MCRLQAGNSEKHQASCCSEKYCDARGLPGRVNSPTEIVAKIYVDERKHGSWRYPLHGASSGARTVLGRADVAGTTPRKAIERLHIVRTLMEGAVPMAHIAALPRFRLHPHGVSGLVPESRYIHANMDSCRHLVELSVYAASSSIFVCQWPSDSRATNLSGRQEAVATALADARQLRRQRNLDRVEILEDHVTVTDELLGKGGFGAVYLADFNGRNAAAKVRSSWSACGRHFFLIYCA